MNLNSQKKWIYLIAITLTLGCFYHQVSTFQFLVYDDGTYILNNPIIKEGLTLSSLKQAFFQFHGANYHPLTWISHALDISLFAFSPKGHHLVNLFWHLLNCFLVYFLLITWGEKVNQQSSSANLYLLSFLFTLLYGVHPLRLEVVAWVSERKELLSTFWGLLAVLSYLNLPSSWKKTSLCVILMSLSLLSKPMLVTLPLIFILFDYWPHKQIQDLKSLKQSVLSKWPYWGLSFSSAIITILAQSHGEAIGSTSSLSYIHRLGNAILSIFIYLKQFFYASPQSILYPHPGTDISWLRVLVLSLVLVKILHSLVSHRRHLPYYFTALMWYFMTLIPVIGIVQVGLQGHADRYTYFPHLGIILLFFSLFLTFSKKNPPKIMIGLCLFILLQGVMSYRYLPHWKDSISIFSYGTLKYKDSPIALLNLGVAYIKKGNFEKAQRPLEEAHQMLPHHFLVLHNLGVLYKEQKDFQKGESFFRKALEQKKKAIPTLYQLGVILLQQQKGVQAIPFLKKSFELGKKDMKTSYHLGLSYEISKDFDQAYHWYRESIKKEPNYSLSWYALGRVAIPLQKKESFMEAHRTLSRLAPNLAKKLTQQLKTLKTKNPS